MATTPSSAKPTGRGRTSNTASVGVAPNDDIIPLILAAHDFTPNYRAMAALDDQHRTVPALEHKFRKWRAKAREISEVKKGENVEASKKAEAKSGKATKKAIKDEMNEAENESDNGEGPSKKPKMIKVPGKTGTVRTTAAAKKRSAPGTDSEEEPPSMRRTRSRKEPPKASALNEQSGTKTRTKRTTIVKKEATPSGSSSETEEHKDAEVPELAKGKPAAVAKPKGKGKVKQEPVDDDEDSGNDGMVEMEFEGPET
jgi:hypothetical protein